jgi:hypothetical protein|nr:hypothetical protein [Methanoculleus marisnigri]
MSPRAKKISNPISSGGGGVIFETRVQAAFAILILTGGHASCLPAWPIKKIKLQGKHLDYNTDDLVIFTKESVSGIEARVEARSYLRLAGSLRELADSYKRDAGWESRGGLLDD